MKKTIHVAIVVVLGLVIFCVSFLQLDSQVADQGRVYQHQENADADSRIGTTTIPEDGIVDPNTFVTHLPLVIIDTKGEELPLIYQYNEADEKLYRDENITNPWKNMEIKLIDQTDYQNRITDAPALASDGYIKIRGASSSEFEKKQYGIKLTDDAGNEQELPILGMEADEDWVLSNSILDATAIRNYMVYNIGGQVFTYTPEVRFCEVLFKNGTEYEYKGLYLLTESVKQAEGRVNIADFDENEERLSYIVCRDRKDTTSTTLSTWAAENDVCYGWFTFKYPKEECLTADVVSRIENQITEIEQVIYSKDDEVFLTYPQYIDVDSFVDYFVINEFFMAYDAGNNSTYYYQDYSHKFSMGPLWDYDNCLDNYKMEVGDPEYIVFVEKPWFERLVRDPEFVDLVCKRYKELRKTILSTEYINRFIDDTVEYLGNAVLRDRSRWRATYERDHMLFVVEDGKDYMIDRNREEYSDEIIRLKDTIKCHGEWMDKYMEPFLSDYEKESLSNQQLDISSGIFILFLCAFLITIVLLKRRIKK